MEESPNESREGVTEEPPEGLTGEPPEGLTEELTEESPDESPEGLTEEPDESPDESPEGSPEGLAEGSPQGPPDLLAQQRSQMGRAMARSSVVRRWSPPEVAQRVDLPAPFAGLATDDLDEFGEEIEMRGGWVPDKPDRDLAPAVGAPEGMAGMVDRLRGGRWSLSPRHVVVIGVILVAGVAWALWVMVTARPEAVADDRPTAGIESGAPVGGATASARPGSSTSAAGPALREVVVHVAGKVRRPGLVRARSGARVADVLAAAGGALPGVDLTSLNLARQVADGEQIVVGMPGAGEQVRQPTPGPGATDKPGSGAPLDLNTATAAQLEELPGVGPVLAQRIIEWRTEHGRFSSIDELQEVTGVGAKKFESLKSHVRV
jgi:competence protein ComEA